MIYLKLIIMAVFWGGGFVATKLIAPQAGSFTIAFLRFAIVSVVLFGVVRVIGFPKRMSIKTWGLVTLGALFGVFGYTALFLTGIEYIEAGRASVIISLVPLSVAVFSLVFLNEKMGLVKFAGFVLSLIGVSIVITQGRLSQIFETGFGTGEWLMFGCVLCMTGYSLVIKQILKNIKPLQAMFFTAVIGTCLLFVPALIEVLRQWPSEIQPVSFIFNLFYIACLTSVVAVSFYYEGISKVGPARASQFMNLIPVFAIVFSWFFLKENLDVSLIFGATLVIGGLSLANIKFGKEVNYES